MDNAAAIATPPSVAASRERRDARVLRQRDRLLRPGGGDELWQRWNRDPLLIVALVALAVCIGRGRSTDARAGWAAI